MSREVRGSRMRARLPAMAADAADEMDAEYSTYQAHESGWPAFDRKTARKYAEFFRVNVDWLDEEIGPMKGEVSPDLLAGLSPEEWRQVLDFISFLKSKHRTD
jgi:DNA-binding XRE family transcriptional regulator